MPRGVFIPYVHVKKSTALLSPGPAPDLARWSSCLKERYLQLFWSIIPDVIFITGFWTISGAIVDGLYARLDSDSAPVLLMPTVTTVGGLSSAAPQTESGYISAVTACARREYTSLWPMCDGGESS